VTAAPALHMTVAGAIDDAATRSRGASVPDQKLRPRQAGAKTNRQGKTGETAPNESAAAEEQRARPHIVQRGTSIPEPAWQPGCDPSLWWLFYLEGTRGRPAPGTEVLVDRRDRAGNPVVQSVRVLPYEGCWPSHSFPVLDVSGLTTSLSTSHDGRPMGWRFPDDATYIAAATPRYRADVLGQAS
jgi:hypothetical protein